jgi:hypothetical protein
MRNFIVTSGQEQSPESKGFPRMDSALVLQLSSKPVTWQKKEN